ncbi:hypothetical protein ACQEV4_43710 [Streptomyces shenzhenensis]|uniref:hypothetical protein n=1 Tax=Streptomyces shenzhenensis TaxID=943815 RepID=UPI003D92E295
MADASTLTDLGLDSLAVVELIDFLVADLGLQLQDDTPHPAMTVDEAVGTAAGQREVVAHGATLKAPSRPSEH